MSGGQINKGEIVPNKMREEREIARVLGVDADDIFSENTLKTLFFLTFFLWEYSIP